MIIPLLDNIVVEPIIEGETKTGIILPEYAATKSTGERFEGKGKVIAVGNGIRKQDGEMIPLLVKKGDVIYFSRCTPIKIDDKDYLMTKEAYVLIIIKDDKKDGK